MTPLVQGFVDDPMSNPFILEINLLNKLKILIDNKIIQSITFLKFY